MEIRTGCKKCEKELAKYVCAMCGSNIGENCYDSSKGVCKYCIKKVD